MKQGWGPISPGSGQASLAVLEASAEAAIFEMDDGAVVVGKLDGWGRDFGEEWPHLYLRTADSEVHLVSAAEIKRVCDPVDGRGLYQRDGWPS